ncbi:MAG: kinase-like domain-containing protein, partial [Piptocephalis tieghemiana]
MPESNTFQTTEEEEPDDIPPLQHSPAQVTKDDPPTQSSSPPHPSSTIASHPSRIPPSPSHVHDEEDDDDDPIPAIVDSDPTRRFVRYAQRLGKGAYKSVYRAFDNEDGVEVAWNQLRVDHLSDSDASKLRAEVAILASLSHPNIIQLKHAWNAHNSAGHELVYFITELMTSGTLKRYIRQGGDSFFLKPHVLRQICRQILSSLAYLHALDPPILHRDLKCENIFVNGNTGEVKLGDLGLATVKALRHVTSVIGTPEFMAPELYDEQYDEKIDIYAFGMCVLEMVTKQYPYAECANQAQIYRRVTNQIKPEALANVQDPLVKDLITQCLDSNPEQRPSAHDLLTTHPCL